jgi:hypothetical protein
LEGKKMDTISPEEAKRRFSKLAPQQKRFLRLFCQNKSQAEIAEALNLAENTIKAMMSQVVDKLGLREIEHKERTRVLISVFCPCFEDVPKQTQPEKPASEAKPEVKPPEPKPDPAKQPLKTNTWVVYVISVLVGLVLCMGATIGFLLFVRDNPGANPPVDQAITESAGVTPVVVGSSGYPTLEALGTRLALTQAASRPSRTPLVVPTQIPTNTPGPTNTSPPTLTPYPSDTPLPAIFTEDFNNATISPQWAIIEGDYALVDGRLTTSSRDVWLTIPAPSGNYGVQMDVLTNNNNGVALSPFFKNMDEFVVWELEQYRNYWVETDWPNGKKWNELSSYLPGGDKTIVRMEVVNRVVLAFINQQKINSMSQPNYSTSSVVVKVGNGASIDNFVIYSLP